MAPLMLHVPDELLAAIDDYMNLLLMEEGKRRTARRREVPDVKFLPNPITKRAVVLHLLTQGLASPGNPLDVLKKLYETAPRRGRPPVPALTEPAPAAAATAPKRKRDRALTAEETMNELREIAKLFK